MRQKIFSSAGNEVAVLYEHGAFKFCFSSMRARLSRRAEDVVNGPRGFHVLAFSDTEQVYCAVRCVFETDGMSSV